MLRYLTAGESHGKALTVIVDGFPAGVRLDSTIIDAELRRRQGGHGRGGRQRIESDTVEVLSGVWRGVTMGSPVTLQVVNRDSKLERLDDVQRPRPGHADLAGAVKYHAPVRAILERASARETAVRVAAGALTKLLLSEFQIDVFGYVLELGGMRAEPVAGSIDQLRAIRDASPVYSLNPTVDSAIVRLIDETGKEGDTLGGVVEVRAEGVPFGLGTHAQWDLKLRGRLAHAVLSVQAFWGVEFGLGFEAARRKGSQVHDPIDFDPRRASEPCMGYIRPTNHAGGIEGGMSNGQPIVLRAAKKPISTLRQPLRSINLATKQPEDAAYERSDVCAVPAASVVVENVVAFEIAAALVEKFGGDSLDQMRQNYQAFRCGRGVDPEP
jgi:chorismate synthase